MCMDNNKISDHDRGTKVGAEVALRGIGFDIKERDDLMVEASYWGCTAEAICGYLREIGFDARLGENGESFIIPVLEREAMRPLLDAIEDYVDPQSKDRFKDM